jgi:signal transduction histidine kinase
LIKVNTEKDFLFSIIAHDLKSPMLSVLAQEHFLAKSIRTANNPELTKSFDELRSSTKKIFKLLEDLLDWALIQLGKMKYYPEKIDLLLIVNKTISLLKEKAAQKSIQIIVQIAYSSSIFSDPEMIAIVLRNLLDNAIKFSNRGSKILISCQDIDNNFARISVTDSGPGIDEYLEDKIFHIGQCYSGTGSLGEKGTGLGLILCRELVEKNGGKIWYKRGKKGGTTFFFTLPKEP